MPLPAGTRLGHYTISTPLGSGGMGEVYRATDTKLGRDVALKMLPESVTHDAERLARFRREAQILASLNHPHIAAIHGTEEIDGLHVLVLELVDGESLADRLRRGPVPLDEALAVAREIALALEAAHERGIVHRDLKPGNVALTRDGTAKVLDFGLARATEAGSVQPAPDVVNSPTITSPLELTALGVILGTAAYMSPEQARGAVADRRSDVWAFGCVLYAMLTGTRAFAGEDVTDTLAAVVRGQPDWARLPAAVPAAVRALLEGCLEKDRRRRIGDIAVARFVLERGPSLAGAAPAKVRARWLAPAVGAAALALAVIAVLPDAGGRSSPSPPLVRFTVHLPEAQQLGLARRAVSISPDGTRLVFAADGRLYVRSISDFDSHALAGSEGALQPAFSPDGQSLVFWADGAIKRLALAGGVPQRLHEASTPPFGLSWTSDGIIVVELEHGGRIVRLSPNGGTPADLVPFREIAGLAQGATLLPKGEALLFALSRALGQTDIWDRAQVVVQSLGTGERKVVIEGGSNPVYVPTGHILYLVEGTLMAVPFDLTRREVVGAAVPVVEGVRRAPPAAGGEAQFALSATGMLVYVPGPARAGHESVFIYSENGTAEQLTLPAGTYGHPRVSPDGAWVALEAHDGRQWSIALYQVSGNTALRRLTFGGNDRFPIWAPDSRQVVFQSDREGDLALFRQPLTGGAAERLTRPESGTAHVPESWSSQHGVLLFSVVEGNTYTLSTMTMKDRAVAPFADAVSTAFPLDAVFSPDGAWVAFQVGDGRTGEATLFVQPFPPTGAKFQIARGGRPLWSPDGTQLYFIPAPGRLMVTTITTTGDSFAFTAPHDVPRRFGLAPPHNPRTFDFLPDGRLVGINTPLESSSARATEIRVVQNWFEELKARVPSPGR